MVKERIPLLFDRAIRPEWLDFAMDQRFRTAGEAEFAERVRVHLQDQVIGTEALRKTVRQLQRTVGFRSPLSEERLRATYEEMQRLPPDARAHERVKLLMDANVFVADCVTTLRRLQDLAPEGIQLRHLYERIVPRYGERESVRRCVRYVLTTLAGFGALSNQNHRWRWSGNGGK